jgi:hypothetical protein
MVVAMMVSIMSIPSIRLRYLVQCHESSSITCVAEATVSLNESYQSTLRENGSRDHTNDESRTNKVGTIPNAYVTLR